MNESHRWISDGGSREQDLTGIRVFLCSAVSIYTTQNHSAGCNNAAGSLIGIMSFLNVFIYSVGYK